jgi:hypothetical protein
VKSLSSELINVGKKNVENFKNESNVKVKKINSFNSLKPTSQPHEQLKPFTCVCNHRKPDVKIQDCRVKNKVAPKNLIPPWEVSTTKYNPLHITDTTNNGKKNTHMLFKRNVIRKAKSDLNIKTSANSFLSKISYSGSFRLINKDRSYDKNKDQTSEILTSTRLVHNEEQARNQNPISRKANSNNLIQYTNNFSLKKRPFTSLPRPKLNQSLSRRTSSLEGYKG